MVEEICHVCKKEKKPYIIFTKADIFSYLQYEYAREDGPICERCNSYHAMTGELKEPTEEEFEIAKKSAWFANMMQRWWEKDEKMVVDEAEFGANKRDWEGYVMIAKWCRETLLSKKVKL